MDDRFLPSDRYGDWRRILARPAVLAALSAVRRIAGRCVSRAADRGMWRAAGLAALEFLVAAALAAAALARALARLGNRMRSAVAEALWSVARMAGRYAPWVLDRSVWRVAAVVLAVAVTLAGAATFFRYYSLYSAIVDARLTGEVFAETAGIYAAPHVIHTGDAVTADEVAARLRRAGLEPVDGAPAADGAYSLAVEDTGTTILVSSEDRPDYRLEFGNGRLVRAIDVESGIRFTRVELPAELITQLFDDTRTKRRVLDRNELPPRLEDAILASEDRRFYNHYGIDLVRVFGAAYANLRGPDRQGASTLTMQLAGSFFLDRSERTWSRKAAEALTALILERRLTKQQILTMYANEVYLGHRNSFAIHGFGEAADAYFGKDIGELTLPETATLVGMLPAPNAYAPTRSMERSLQRRDTVLGAMFELGMIDENELARAREEEIVLSEGRAGQGAAPYMVDYIRDRLLDDFEPEELVRGGLRVYTTLDPDLQRAAVQAVAGGISSAQEQLEAMGRGFSSGEPPVQAALVVLDPHTGAILAMVGGRDYAASQYNRITEALRQPGSVFKPFVYAAALETAYDPLPVVLEEPEELVPIEVRGLGPGPDPALSETDGKLVDLDLDRMPERDEEGTIETDSIITPLTTLVDEPTYFFYEDKYYAPDNYGSVFHGLVTVREALQRSLNVPTVKVAERVGYDRVAELARRVGFDADVQPYPSIALGAFEVTPIEIAGAWTALANAGVRVEPRAIQSVRSGDGEVLASYPAASRTVLRPEVAAVMTRLLENVIDSGTGARVRASGFRTPAAGKTGTSSDGWFAGYTRDLLAIAWVGFDDNRELGLEGSRSALPIWTAFMMEAERLRPPRRPMEFVNPRGVEVAEIDPETLGLATPACVERFEEIFIEGTAPSFYCPVHGFRFNPFRGIGRALSGIFSGR